MLGGFKTIAQIATPEIQKFLNKHIADINSHLGLSVSDYDAITFTSQVVNGTNYLIKVRGDGQFYHVKIYKPLPSSIEPSCLVDIQTGHSLTSALKPF